MPLTNLVKGDDWKFIVNVTDDAGSPLDVTGGSLWITMKNKTDLGGGSDATAVFQVKDLDLQDVNDAENDVINGKVVLRARRDSAGTSPPANTLVAAGSYVYDVQYMTSAGQGSSVATLELGTVNIQEQVTEAA